MAQGARNLGDAKLDLQLQELINGPRLSDIEASPIAGVLKGLWTALTFYQWTPAVRTGFDAGIRAAQARHDSFHQANAIAQVRDAMLADPDFYPFCLSPMYWPDAQRAHFRGLVGQTTYQAPVYWSAVASDAAKLVLPVLAGAGLALFLPEEAVAGAVAIAAARVVGREVTAKATGFIAKTVMGSGLAIGGSALASSLSGPSASDAARQNEMWRRYQIETRRRSMH